jgi:transcriptional regulator GlxA family with amidase domain
MQQNIDTPGPVAEIARRLGVAKRRLERRFQACIDMPPTAAYRMIRLEHAEYLLAHSKRSITAIAAESGFCDSSHFIRAFRERYGRTPAAFREAA